MMTEIMLIKERSEKWSKNEQSIREMWENVNCTNYAKMKVAEEANNKIPSEITAKFHNLMKNVPWSKQEAQ